MARLPSAVDIQSVGIRRDPGLSIPNTSSVGAGFIQAGQFLGGVADTVFQEAERQRKQYDAATTSEALLAADRQAAEEYTRVLQEDDPSRPDFVTDRKAWLEKRNQDIVANLPADVTEEARTSLSQKLAQDALSWEIQYAEDNVSALDRRSKDAFSGIVSKYEANVARSPEMLDDFVAMATDELDSFRGSMKAETEAKAFRDAKARVVGSAVDAMVAKRNFKAAERVLESGKYDEFIDAPRLIRDIEVGKRNAEIEARTEARATVALTYDDELASARATGKRAGLVSDDLIMRAYPDRGPQMVQELRNAEEFHYVMTDVKNTTPEQDQAMISGLTPEGAGFANEEKQQEMYRRAVADKRARLGIGTEQPGDPVQYLVQNSPRIKALFEQSGEDLSAGQIAPVLIEEQMRLGVPQERIRIMSDSQIAKVNESIVAADTNGKVETVMTLASSYGDYWDEALNEMVAKGMDPGMAMVGVVADDPSTAQRLAAAYDMGDTELKKGLNTADVRDATEALDDLMVDYQSAFTSGDFTGGAIEGVNKLRDAAMKLTLQNLRRGDDKGKAAEDAYNAMIGTRYEIIDESRVKAVLPKSIDGTVVLPDRIIDSLETSFDDLEKFDIDYDAFPSPELSGVAPELRADLMKQRVDMGIKNGGFWTMDRTGRNMVLMVQLSDGSALPVLRKDRTSEGREIVRNADGSVSTERTITITDDRINDGKPTNIPTMFGGQSVDQTTAIDIIAENNGFDPDTGLPFASYDSIEAAVAAAVERSKNIGESISLGDRRIIIPVLDAQEQGLSPAEKSQERMMQRAAEPGVL